MERKASAGKEHPRQPILCRVVRRHGHIGQRQPLLPGVVVFQSALGGALYAPEKGAGIRPVAPAAAVGQPSVMPRHGESGEELSPFHALECPGGGVVHSGAVLQDSALETGGGFPRVVGQPGQFSLFFRPKTAGKVRALFRRSPQVFLYGLLSSASFGLIPLFTIPAMQAGMQFESILFYRFLFACMALGGILLINGQSFRISRRDIPSLLLLAILYLMSAVFLFWGYKFMAIGVATTIHFMYPVLTTLVMMLFFKEKKSGWRIAAIASAVIGVYFLSGGNTETGSFSFFGLFIVLLSALGYALYLVTMSQLKIGRMKGLLLTFYVFLFGGIFRFIGTSSISHLQPIREWHTAGNLILLALIPTVVSNLALVRAVKSIGSTLTSVLGAMEPVTAVCVGIFLFGEAFTTSIGVGIALIIVAVMVIILKR